MSISIAALFGVFAGILEVKFLSSNLLHIHHQQTELSMREVDELMQHQLSEAQRRQVKTWINQTYMYTYTQIYIYAGDNLDMLYTCIEYVQEYMMGHDIH